ncbi:MAG: T9SS type A sorting domain-containing protein [Lentimicrobiaceae bacterium]
METNDYINANITKRYFIYISASWISVFVFYAFTYLAIFNFSVASAQTTWCPEGAIWHYGNIPINTAGYLKIENMGDTIILGIDCKKLKKTLYGYDYITHEFSTEIVGFEYTYSDEDKVFIFRGGQFYTLYDFSAQPGNSWIVPSTKYYDSCDTIGRVRVDSIGNMTINNTILRYICVSPDASAPNWGWSAAKIVERIGPVKTYDKSSYDYLFPVKLDYCGMQIDEEIEGGFFRCYSDNTSFQYYSNIVPTCDYIATGLDEPNSQKILIVSPNPFNSYVNIQINKSIQEGDIYIYNTAGQLVKQTTIQKPFMQLDLINLNKGVYLLTIRINQQTLHLKLIKS